MTGYSFDTFETSDRNQAACDICRAIAELRFDGNTPVVLVGPEASGKSHLLWSIVKHLRAHDARASLALVMAREFPERVRRLAAHPAPIQNGRPAVLLIDELERFQHDKEDLEDLVRVFLQNGHPVVAASRVAPAELLHFQDSFRALLSLGQTASVARPETIALQGVGEVATLRAECDTLRAERDQLEEKLAERAPQLAGLGELQKQIRNLEAERDRLKNSASDTSVIKALQLEHAETMNELREEMASLVVDREAARDERDELEKRLARRAEDSQESLHLLQARDEAEEARLRAEAALAESEAERSAAEAHAEALAAQARNLQVRIEDGRIALNEGLEGLDTCFVRLEEAIRRRGPGHIEEIERLESEVGDARALATSYRVQLDQERSTSESVIAALEKQVLKLETGNDSLRTKLDDAKVRAEEAHTRRRAVEFELEKARRQTALASVELDALRHEAAAQVARANIQAGEMEQRANRLQEALDIIRETGRAASHDAIHIEQSVDQIAASARALEARLSSFNQIALPHTDVDEDVTALEPILFEPSAIRSAAETLDTLARDWRALEPEAAPEDDTTDADEEGPGAVGQSAV